MLIDLEQWRTRLPIGQADGANVSSSFVRTAAGEGAFAFDAVTLGVVLSPQPSHRARYGGDRVTAYPVAAGEGWVFPPGMEGYCAWDGPHEFVNVALPASAFPNAEATRIGRVGAGPLDPLVVALALQVHAAGPDAPDTSLYRGTLAAALGAHLARLYTNQSPAAASVLDDARLKRVRDAIEADLAQPWTLEALAGLAAMSPFHFARCFKATTGLAPHRYLIARRIERAKVLLRTTADPIAAIAFQVGWENPSKFSAQFKTITGATPGAWRADGARGGSGVRSGV